MVALRGTFDRQLKSLDDEVLRLAELVSTQLKEAVKALQNRDLDAARRVDAFDTTINEIRYNIEEQCYTMLALQQPNARDLRRIVAAVSIATNLERMGDHAAGIARVVLRMEAMPTHIQMPIFAEMGQMAVDNLHNAMTALIEQNAVLARTVVARDEVINQMQKRAYAALLQTMTANPATVEYATLLLWVSHDLERFADRISNICERIIYTITGNLFEQRTPPPF